jgi:hypothetical protein
MAAEKANMPSVWKQNGMGRGAPIMIKRALKNVLLEHFFSILIWQYIYLAVRL